MRLLVTGGAGFIGSNFIRYWLGADPDDKVVNLDLLTYAGDPSSLSDVVAQVRGRYRFVQGDIADAPLVEDMIASERPDVIVNFAAESHNSRAVLDSAPFVRTNVVGTHVLLEAARRHDLRFHHISTCEVYGDLPLDSGESFSESSPYRPRTPYSASKAAADMLVRSYHLTSGVHATISNCSNNYGPFQHPEKLIPLFTTNALEGIPLPLYRASGNRREWLHVDDHCRAIELIVRRGRPGETYNIGSGEERAIEQVADGILSALGRSAELKRYVEDRPAHDRRYLLDHRKISRDLGWEPRISFDEGLRRTIEWYATHRPWWDRKKARATAELDETGWAMRKGRG